VRLFSSLQLVVAPPACKPGQDTPANFIRVLTTGSGSATADGGAFALSHGSRLFSLKLLFISQSSGVVFNIAGAWKFFTEPAEFPWSSRYVRSFCPPFGVFLWAVLILFKPARAVRTVLMHSSNYSPSGWLRFNQARNRPDLLDSARRGFLSRLAAKSLIRIWRCANIARGTGEFCLAGTCAPVQRSQINQPDL